MTELIVFLGALSGGFVSGLAGFRTGLTALGIWLHVMQPALASSRVADGIVGFGGGILGGLAGMSGPLPTMWATLRAWGKDDRRSVFQAFNLTTLVAALICHAMSGLLTADLALCTTLCTRAITALGVRAGATSPYHPLTSYPGKPASAIVGTFGSAALRRAVDNQNATITTSPLAVRDENCCPPRSAS